MTIEARGPRGAGLRFLPFLLFVLFALVAVVVAVVGFRKARLWELQSIVSQRASTDVACAERDLDVGCHGGVVFHFAEQFTCEANGCGRRAEYRCEMPLRQVGPIELYGPARCE